MGSATAELLLAEGAGAVTIFDNFFQGSAENLKHLAGDGRLKTVQGDVLRLPQLIDATRGVDGVLHLAAVMSLTMDRDPWMGLDVNVRGTQNVIEACCTTASGSWCSRPPNASTATGRASRASGRDHAVPTRPLRRPLPSSTAPPRSSASSSAAMRTPSAGSTSTSCLRYSTVYGERQHYRAANALYIIETYDRVRQGQRPRVIGDGSETKHFVHVSDVARANVAALASGATNVAVNVSGPRPVTTLELVRLVTELAGKDLAPEHVEPDPARCA